MIITIIAHCEGKARGQFPGLLRALRAKARPACRPGSAGRDQRTILRTGLLEEPVLSGGSGGSGRLRPGELLSPSAVEGVESLGHDVRGARTAISAGVGDMIAGPALGVRHDRSSTLRKIQEK